MSAYAHVLPETVSLNDEKNHRNACLSPKTREKPSGLSLQPEKSIWQTMRTRLRRGRRGRGRSRLPVGIIAIIPTFACTRTSAPRDGLSLLALETLQARLALPLGGVFFFILKHVIASEQTLKL